MASDLSKDPVLFRYVLHEYLPKKLLAQVPLDEVLRRVPHAYQIAIFAMSIASQSVYETGLSGGDFAFFRFMHNLHARAQKFAEESAKTATSRL
jgi:glutamate dehydrogenase